MTALVYVSEAGDLIWGTSTRTKGREPVGALVWPAAFTENARLAFVCPSRMQPFHEPRSALELADRGRAPDQSCPRDRHPGPANRPCRCRRVG